MRYQKRYCLIGDRVEHSKSHIIHREFLYAYKCGGSYDIFNVEQADLRKAVDLLKNNCDGFNVTKPYKESVIKYLDSMNGAAKFCRSVNTVKMEPDGTAIGYSTDGTGFMRSLMREKVSPEGKNILLLGNGGVAKAIAHELLSFNSNIYVYGRNTERISDFIKQFKNRIGFMDSTLINKYDIIINCTPVGQQPFINETPVPRSYLEGASFVFDTIYNPVETLLLSYAREMGIKHISGADMLIFQGYEAQKIWQGRELTETELYATIDKIKKAAFSS